MKMDINGFQEPRLYSHIEKLYQWRKGIPFFPIKIEISPVGMCNHKCEYCYTQFLSTTPPPIPPLKKSISKSIIDREVFEKFIHELSELPIESITLQGTGEPLLYKNLSHYTSILQNNGKLINLTTNGILLNRHFASDGGILKDLFYIRLSSLDSNPERYSKVHGCSEKDHQILIENIRTASELIKKNNLSCVLYATVYANDDNTDELLNIVRFFKNLGISIVNVSQASYGTRNKGKYESTFSKHLDKYAIEDIKKLSDDNFMVSVSLSGLKSYEERFVKNWKPNSCQGLLFYALIGSDGEVYPCARYWGNKDYSYGSIYENSFAEIWNSNRRKEIYEKINNAPINYDECYVCLHGHINSNLRQLESPSKWTSFL